MANVLVFVELQDERPKASSLTALSEGRRIATEMGATLYSLVPCVGPPQYGENDLIAVLSRHGADKIVLLTAAHFLEPQRFRTHADALLTAIERFPPTLVLFADEPAGDDIAPRLAARLGAAYVSRATLEVNADGILCLFRGAYGGRFQRKLEVDDLERAVVATVMATHDPIDTLGTEEAEAVIVPIETALERPLKSEHERLRVGVMMRRFTAEPREVGGEVHFGAAESAAIEAALQLREAVPNAHICAISVGSDGETPGLELALQLGFDRAIRIWHPALDGADYHALARVLSGAARTLELDLVLLGERSEDEALGAVGPALAEHWGVEHASHVAAVRIADDGKVAFREGDVEETMATPMVLALAPGAPFSRTATIPTAPVEPELWDLPRVSVAPEEIRHRRRYLGKLLAV